MKKTVFILFVAFYSLSSTGFSISFHYCLDKLAGIELFGHENDCCCGQEESMTECCEDERFELSTSEVQQVVSYSYDFSTSYFTFLSFEEVFIEEIVDEQEEYLHSTDIAPPNNRPIWLVNCNLTFYG